MPAHGAAGPHTNPKDAVGPAIETTGCTKRMATGLTPAGRWAARLVLAAAPGEQAGLARLALSRYRGELLPEDPYAPWAASARERLRRRQLELLDLLVADARERGDLDEAVRLLDEAIAAEPLDEERYLQGAEMLLAQGRRGSARGLVERAEAMRAELGLLTSPRLERLRRATRRPDEGVARAP
jgi:DNA-binding SARP family transcriptional activator